MLESIGIAAAGKSLSPARHVGSTPGRVEFQESSSSRCNLMVLAAAHNDLVAGIEAMK